MTCGVLNEHGGEALHRTEGCTVNHHGTVLEVVCTRVFEFKAFGQVVVHLDGTQLPTTSECVLHHKVELRTVEGCFAVFDNGGESLFLTCLDDG